MFRRQTPAEERSAEERVRAAAERAARRAAREGRPVEPPPPETFGARLTAPPEFDEPPAEAHDEEPLPRAPRYTAPPAARGWAPEPAPQPEDTYVDGLETGRAGDERFAAEDAGVPAEPAPPAQAYEVPAVPEPTEPPVEPVGQPTAAHDAVGAEPVGQPTAAHDAVRAEPVGQPTAAHDAVGAEAVGQPTEAHDVVEVEQARPAAGHDVAGFEPVEQPTAAHDAAGSEAVGQPTAAHDVVGQPTEAHHAVEAEEPATRMYPAPRAPEPEPPAPREPSPYEPQHYTAPPPEDLLDDDFDDQDDLDAPTAGGVTQQHLIPETAGPDERTAEWAMPPAPDPPPPTPTTAQPAVPLRGRQGGQPRGRWRPEKGQGPIASTRPLATADDDGDRPPRGGLGRRIGAVLAVVLVALLALFVYAVFQPFHGDGRGAVRVAVPAGADAGRIGDILADRGVVRSSRLFVVNATLTGRRGGMRPGNYTLPRDMSYGAAIDALTKGPKARVVKTFALTIPEGRAARETAARLKSTDSGIDGDYLRASRNPGLLRRARRLGLPRNGKTLEGFLFPATYNLPEGTTATELAGRQLSGFADNTAEVSYARARRANLTRYDVLIIASMIEREVQVDRERPLVAAVIYNRLKQGIPLGIDATIRYSTNNWTRPIRQSELERDDPFNTRLRRGLPPTPIGNPGLASIKAAAKPANSDFLYYVVKPGTKGEHAFSSTDAEFQRDVARYNSAREAQGGQAP